MNLSTQKKALSAAAATSIMLLTAACGGSSSDGADTTSTTTQTTAADSGSASTGSYTDGDYSGSGSYSNPGGTSKVEVKLTLAGGKITAIDVTPEAENPTSKQYQTQFAGGIADQVVGKSLDDIDVSKVAGSSLTSKGFNDAIDQIKAEASA